jgi:asparagine synthase (glutamine-hydrolysing)
MCGIAGIVSGAGFHGEPALRRMVDSLRHRGPDGSAIQIFECCGLGHTRLSVVDLEGGKQPMLSPDRSFAVTFNGEIYGYQEIRRELSGYAFRTTSDTEVLLALFARHGERMMPRLPGMFSFAIWDDRRRLLFCARDRFGEKPFYYATGAGGEFVFASEIRAILDSGLVEPELRKDALVHYLRRGYAHPSQGIYSNVHVLPPAHALVFDRDRIRTWRYWEPPAASGTARMEEAVGEFRRLFERSVSRQLVADVPIGAFLSGGLDSSTVVAAASREKQGLRTLSFGFEGNYDELPFADLVARQYQTDHIALRADAEDLPELLFTMQSVYDEPFADSSNIPTYLLCREARKHLKVVLTGDGGDELLGGYAHYRPLVWLERYRGSSAVTYATARVMMSVFDRLRTRRLARLRDLSRGIVLGRRHGSILEAQRAESTFFSDREITSLGLQAGRWPEPVDGRPGRQNSVADAMHADLEDYMPGDILVKIDRASMAHGLELRAPFLDVDFAGFCLSLPASLKIRTNRDKIILREAYADRWPALVRKRAKQGFGAPVGDWLASPALRSLVDHYLLRPGATICDLLPGRGISNHAREDPHKCWILLTLALWLDSRHAAPPRRLAASATA